MSTGTTHAPNLPVAPIEYDHHYQDQLNDLLRIYFAQLDNPGPSAMSTLYRGPVGNLDINSAINCGRIIAGVPTVSLPTQANIAKLHVGDIYYDTTAGNVLKVKL